MIKCFKDVQDVVCNENLNVLILYFCLIYFPSYEMDRFKINIKLFSTEKFDSSVLNYFVQVSMYIFQFLVSGLT